MTVPPQAAIQLVTMSQGMPAWAPTGKAPIITMNGNAFADLGAPGSPSGFQVVVIDSAGDLTDPANILLNTYIYCQQDNGQWGSLYQSMYSQMISAVLTAGNYEQQLLLIASFGLDADMTPTNDALEFLLDRGAGPGLQKWELTTDAGSMSTGWVGMPACYLLVGNSGYAYGQGAEAYAYNNGASLEASVSVTLQNNVPPT
jgi:hypothetical protein